MNGMALGSLKAKVVKMNRRDFLKKAGLVVCGVSSLGVLGEPTVTGYITRGPVSPSLFPPNGLYWAKKAHDFAQTKGIEPITMNGQKYYVMFMHPKQKYNLDVIIARDKYKHERWVERYNGWAQSQGKPPYVEVEGEAGRISA